MFRNVFTFPKRRKGKVVPLIDSFVLEDINTKRSEAAKQKEAKTDIEKVFKVIDGLGAGGFGTVIKVQEATSKIVLAVKVIPKTKKASRTLSIEIFTMQALKDSSHFLQNLYDAYENASNVFIISEFISGGDLFYYLANEISFSENQVRIILSEVYLGLKHMHQLGFLHCDIKAENVMLDKSGHVKIVDFGLSTQYESKVDPQGGTEEWQQHMRCIGSVPYMSPELIAHHIGGRHTDWWAFGVLAYELFTGCSPWKNEIKSSLTEEILTKHVTLPPSFSTSSQHLIESLLCKDCEFRLGSRKDSEIMKAPFFKHVNWEKVGKLQQPSALLPEPSCTLSIDRENSMNSFIHSVNSPVTGCSYGLKSLSFHHDAENDHVYLYVPPQGTQGITSSLDSLNKTLDLDVSLASPRGSSMEDCSAGAYA